MLTPLGFEGDAHAHPAIHGGPLKAVLLLANEVIERLKAEGYPVYPGALGENLTTEGLDYRYIRAGQRFRAGQAFLEITRIRVPCSTLDLYNSPGKRIQDAIYDTQVEAGDPSSPRWGMSGFYARVVDPGMIRTKDIITLTDQAV
jgi:MOSC domain-containing protein YiiM